MFLKNLKSHPIMTIVYECHFEYTIKTTHTNTINENVFHFYSIEYILHNTHTRIH